MVRIEWVLNIPDGLTRHHIGSDTIYIDIQKWYGLSRDQQIAVIEHEKLHILHEKNMVKPEIVELYEVTLDGRMDAVFTDHTDAYAYVKRTFDEGAPVKIVHIKGHLVRYPLDAEV